MVAVGARLVVASGELPAAHSVVRDRRRRSDYVASAGAGCAVVVWRGRFGSEVAAHRAALGACAVQP